MAAEAAVAGVYEVN